MLSSYPEYPRTVRYRSSTVGWNLLRLWESFVYVMFNISITVTGELLKCGYWARRGSTHL